MNGPDWQMIAQWLLGMVTTLVGFYARGISARVTKLESDFGGLHSMVKGDYPTRQEINQSFDQVQQGLRAITTRLDNLIDHSKG